MLKGGSINPKTCHSKQVLHIDLRRRIQRRLLKWFSKYQRQLPWRQNRDPYHIWVSEVMLQQTQVAKVTSYFVRFLAAFPTLKALASASESEVLRVWEGLGYYRRARDLHRSARLLISNNHNTVPDDPKLVQELPGFGRYMVGAVLSQAYGRVLPIIEANSERVISRLLGQRRDPTLGPVRRQLWHVAESLIPHGQAGEFNQALMELGALICSPRPHCESCPLADDCAAKIKGLENVIPARKNRREPVHVNEVGVVVKRAGRVMLVQRPVKGRWGSLWEFPHGMVNSAEDHEIAASRMVFELSGIRVYNLIELVMIRHSVTHHRIRLLCFEAEYEGGEFQSDFYIKSRWVAPGKLGFYPVSMPQRRVAQALTQIRQKAMF